MVAPKNCWASESLGLLRKCVTQERANVIGGDRKQAVMSKGGGRPNLVEPEEGILLCGTEEALPETLSGSSQVLGMLRELGGSQARGWLTCPTSHWESEVLLKMRIAPFSCTLWKRNPQKGSQATLAQETRQAALAEMATVEPKNTSRLGCAPRRLGNDHRSRHPLEAPSISAQSVETDSSDSSDTLLRQASMRNFGKKK